MLCYGGVFHGGRSEFQGSQVFHMRRLALAVQRHEEREAHSHLGCSDGDDEEYHHLAIEVVVVSREGHQREVGRIEHQFETHEDHEEVAARDHAQQTQAEEQRADDQVVVKSGSHRKVGFRWDALGLGRIWDPENFNGGPSW